MKNPNEEKPKNLPDKEGDKIIKKALEKGFKKESLSTLGAKAARENISGLSSEVTEFSGSTMKLLAELFPKINLKLEFDKDIEKLSSTYISKAEILRQAQEELDSLDSEINELKNSVREYEKPHQKAILLDKADETVYKLSLRGVELEKKKLDLKNVIKKGEEGLGNIAKKIKTILDRVQLQ